jgi:hypothetical protein
VRLQGKTTVSIKPPSDIVLDVAKAADPASSAAATERLARIGGDSGKSDPAFADVMSEVETAPPVAMEANAGAPIPVHTGSAPLLRQPQFSEAPVDAETKAYQGFQAVLLQNVLSMMLPESSDFFGEGSAGEIWRSMLAEQLGNALSKKMDLGIMPRYLHDAHHHEMKHDPAMVHGLSATDPVMIPELSAAMNQSLDLTPDQS